MCVCVYVHMFAGVYRGQRDPGSSGAGITASCEGPPWGYLSSNCQTWGSKTGPLTSHLGGTGADAGVCMHSGYPKNSKPPSLAEYLSRNKIRPKHSGCFCLYPAPGQKDRAFSCVIFLLYNYSKYRHFDDVPLVAAAYILI